MVYAISQLRAGSSPLLLQLGETLLELLPHQGLLQLGQLPLEVPPVFAARRHCVAAFRLHGHRDEGGGQPDGGCAGAGLERHEQVATRRHAQNSALRIGRATQRVVQAVVLVAPRLQHVLVHDPLVLPPEVEVASARALASRRAPERGRRASGPCCRNRDGNGPWWQRHTVEADAVHGHCVYDGVIPPQQPHRRFAPAGEGVVDTGDKGLECLHDIVRPISWLLQ
mmetsp:Transcript_105875/g.304445  ORF Transcript_105875/g.304445 Transcript_105875/m.304445 type:complete len:225 (-) Transcript_105875:101-775(-)